MKPSRAMFVTLAIATLFAVGCGGGPAGSGAVSPVGNWTTTLQYGPADGSCNATGTVGDSLTVTQTGPSTIGLSDSSGGTTTGGWDPSTRTLSAQTVGQLGNGDAATVSRDYTLNGTAITGNGSFNDNTLGCFQTLTVVAGTFAP
jgi:hypothetical protein